MRNLTILIGFVISKCANISAHLDINNCPAVDKEKALRDVYAYSFVTKKRQMLKSQYFSAENCCYLACGVV